MLNRRSVPSHTGLRFILVLLVIALLSACGSASAPPATGAQTGAQLETPATALPSAAITPGARLRVLATTTLVGDAVRRVGGDLVDLTVLLPAGSDPHAFVASPQDLVALESAQVVFINGLGLEESLLPALGKVEQGPVVSVNESVPPLAADTHTADDAEEIDAHGSSDPHTWQDVRNVALWVTTISEALTRLDPANADAYAQAAAAYRAELEALHADVAATIATIPPERRLLVTDHDDLAWFAAAYDMKVVGAVTPSFSSMASISAQEMAALQDQIAAQGVPAIFVGATVNPRLANQVAQDTGARVIPLYTDSLSAADGPATTYVQMMRSNAQAIADALR